MEQNHKQEIEEIISQTACPKGFACHGSAFEVLCKAQDIGVESFLICLEEDPRKCKFSLPLKRGDICECPLRIYIAKKLNK